MYSGGARIWFLRERSFSPIALLALDAMLLESYCTTRGVTARGAQSVKNSVLLHEVVI